MGVVDGDFLVVLPNGCFAHGERSATGARRCQKTGNLNSGKSPAAMLTDPSLLQNRDDAYNRATYSG